MSAPARKNDPALGKLGIRLNCFRFPPGDVDSSMCDGIDGDEPVMGMSSKEEREKSLKTGSGALWFEERGIGAVSANIWGGVTGESEASGELVVDEGSHTGMEGEASGV